MNKQIYLLLFVVLGFECILRPCVRDAILYEKTNRKKRQKSNYVRNQPLWRKILYVFPIKDHVAKRHLMLFYLLRAINCLFLVIVVLELLSIIPCTTIIAVIILVFDISGAVYPFFLPKMKGGKIIDFSQVKKP